MRRKMYICIGLVFCITALVSCIKDPTVDLPTKTSKEQEPAFMIDEARAFVESSPMAAIRVSEGSKYKLFDMESYTPLWDSAVVSQDDKIASVDVPIFSNRVFRAHLEGIENGKPKDYIVNIHQKIVIIKSLSSGHMSQALLSLIHDWNYPANKVSTISDEFIHAGDKGNYSGYAVYTYGGVPIGLRRYVDGAVVGAITVSGHNQKSTPEQSRMRIENHLRKMKIQYFIMPTMSKNVTIIRESDQPIKLGIYDLRQVVEDEEFLKYYGRSVAKQFDTSIGDGVPIEGRGYLFADSSGEIKTQVRIIGNRITYFMTSERDPKLALNGLMVGDHTSKIKEIFELVEPAYGYKGFLVYFSSKYKNSQGLITTLSYKINIVYDDNDVITSISISGEPYILK